MRHRRCVAEGHDASIGDLIGEEIFQPEGFRLRVNPGVEGVAAEAADGHDTRETAISDAAEPTETAPVDLQEGLTQRKAMS